MHVSSIIWLNRSLHFMQLVCNCVLCRIQFHSFVCIFLYWTLHFSLQSMRLVFGAGCLGWRQSRGTTWAQCGCVGPPFQDAPEGRKKRTSVDWKVQNQAKQQDFHICCLSCFYQKKHELESNPGRSRISGGVRNGAIQDRLKRIERFRKLKAGAGKRWTWTSTPRPDDVEAKWPFDPFRNEVNYMSKIHEKSRCLASADTFSYNRDISETPPIPQIHSSSEDAVLVCTDIAARGAFFKPNPAVSFVLGFFSKTHPKWHWQRGDLFVGSLQHIFFVEKRGLDVPDVSAVIHFQARCVFFVKCQGYSWRSRESRV